MRGRTTRTVRGIVDWRLCLGCGACAYICPDRKIQLAELLNEGVRPIVTDEECGTCRECLDVCPAYESDLRAGLERKDLLPELKASFGPVLEAWEGHAADPDIRRNGSSGGLITALCLFALEAEGYHGVAHVAANPDDPVRNRTRLSRTRSELLAGAGSRYSPGSACDILGAIERVLGRCAFVGQPGEVIGLRKAAARRPDLARNLGVVISFFCAGSPSTAGTLRLLERCGIPLSEVEQVRYRGRGWPGHFAVWRKGAADWDPLMTYEESWGFLQRFRPFSVHLHPDASGEAADLSCGDPWYRPPGNGEPGLSLVLARTDLGRDFLRRAREQGVVRLDPLEPAKVMASQANLVQKRGAIAGRVATLRVLGLPAPRLRGFSLLRNWLKLPVSQKLKSTFGTLRRVCQRRYFTPLVVADHNQVAWSGPLTDSNPPSGNAGTDAREG